MKIVLFTGSLKTGGAEHQFSILARGLAELGHVMTLVTFYPGGSYWSKLNASPLKNLELRSLWPSRPKWVGRRAFHLVAGSRRLREILRQIKPDIIYSALDTTNLLAKQAAQPLEIPVVWGVRGAHEGFGPKTTVPFRLCQKASKHVPLMIGNSQAAIDFHLQAGFRPKKTAVIHNGIDTDHFRPSAAEGRKVREEHDIPSDAIVVGRVGRLTQVKDHRSLIRAASLVLKQQPNAWFLCVGDGPEAYRRQLETEVADAGLQDRWTWAGDRPDAWRYYNAMDVAVSNSISESFPNVVAEAMACGVPCVVTEVGESRQIIGDLGESCHPKDAAGLASATVSLLARPKDRPACFNRIKSNYSIGQSLNRTEASLQEVMDEFDVSLD